MNAASDLLQKLYNTVFGMSSNTSPTAPTRTEPNDVPAWAQANSKPALVTASRGMRTLKRNEVVPEGLKEALEEFLTEEVSPYAHYTNTRFRIDQISTYVTADNKAMLSDLENMKKAIRTGIAKACIEQVTNAASLLEIGNGFEWKIEPAPDASGDDRGIYSVLAGNGPEQVALSFLFYGDYVAVEPVEPAEPKVKIDAATSPASADDMATFEITPIATPHQTGTHSPPVLRLRITEAGQPTRNVEVSRLPLMLGRGSACGVTLSSPYMSRIHAVIRLASNGKLVLENNSAKGTQITTPRGAKQIDLGQHMELPLEGRFTLAEAAGTGAAHIDFEQCHTVVDTQATFDISPLSPSPYLNAKDDLPIQDLTHPIDASDTGATFCFTERSDKTSGRKAKAQAPQPLARLWVRNGNGAVTSEFIYELPFVVGREPKQANSMKVTDPALWTSREHLVIEKIKGSAFYTHNMAWAANKGGTWVKTAAGTEPLGEYFPWQPGTPGGPDGWLELGRNPDPSQVNSMGVQVRLERAL